MDILFLSKNTELRYQEDLIAMPTNLQIDEDLTARINMGDYKFSFHEKGKEYNPAWIAPEGENLGLISKSICKALKLRSSVGNTVPNIFSL